MRKPGRGQILENRLVGPREVLGGGDRRVPAKGRGRTAPCRGRSGASWIWATPLTPARARGSSVRATPSLRPPRILKTSLFLQKGGPRKEPSQRTATALFYLIPCGDLQLSPREFYLSLITPTVRARHATHDGAAPVRLRARLVESQGPGRTREAQGWQGQGRSLGPAAEQGRQPACRHRSSAIDTVLAYLSPGSFEAVPGPARVQSASPFPLKTAPGAYAVCSKMAQRGIEE